MLNSQNEQDALRRWVWVLLGKGAGFVFQGVVTTAVQVGLVFVFLTCLVTGFRDEFIGGAACWGFGMGAVVGLFIYGGLYGVMIFSSPPNCRELEPGQFYGAVFWGMAIGIIAAGSSFFCFAWLDGYGHLNLDRDFANSLLLCLLISVPVAMVCGGIGGAVWKWGRLKIESGSEMKRNERLTKDN